MLRKIFSISKAAMGGWTNRADRAMGSGVEDAIGFSKGSCEDVPDQLRCFGWRRMWRSENTRRKTESSSVVFQQMAFEFGLLTKGFAALWTREKRSCGRRKLGH